MPLTIIRINNNFALNFVMTFFRNLTNMASLTKLLNETKNQCNMYVKFSLEQIVLKCPGYCRRLRMKRQSKFWDVATHINWFMLDIKMKFKRHSNKFVYWKQIKIMLNINLFLIHIIDIYMYTILYICVSHGEIWPRLLHNIRYIILAKCQLVIVNFVESLNTSETCSFFSFFCLFRKSVCRINSML